MWIFSKALASGMRGEVFEGFDAGAVDCGARARRGEERLARLVVCGRGEAVAERAGEGERVASEGRRGEESMGVSAR